MGDVMAVGRLSRDVAMGPPALGFVTAAVTVPVMLMALPLERAAERR
jgi:hypothetical protein